MLGCAHPSVKQHRRVSVTRTSEDGRRVTVEVMRFLTLEEARAEAKFRHTFAKDRGT